jgi:two-component system cell cycle response regulator
LKTGESVKVISFNEKHYARLLQENEELRTQISELFAVARANQQIQDHFETLEHKILRSRSLKEMARTIVREIKKRFQVDHVTLCLAIAQDDILQKSQARPRRTRNLLNLRIMDPQELSEALPNRPRGPIIGGKGEPFFPAEVMESIRSQAIVPLYLSRELIGTVNLGSIDPDRYATGMATDFLQRLGGKISLIIDNILTRQRLTELSVTDQLTGISNRRFLDQALAQEVMRAQRYDLPLACMVVDLDGFKAVNDRHGHEVGDRALRHVAGLLEQYTRRNDVVARYGGDEFAVLLPHTSLDSAVKVAQKYQDKLKENAFMVEGGVIDLGLSIGIAALPEVSLKRPEELIKEADRRLFLAKAQGGGVVIAGA